MMLPAPLAGLPAPGNCCPKGLASLAVAHMAISEGQSAAVVHKCCLDLQLPQMGSVMETLKC